MPELSRFYGIVIQVYSEQDVKHHEPHIHAIYSGEEAVLALNGVVLAGRLPPNQLRYVQVWLDIHASEVREAWDLAVRRQPTKKIAPLR